MCKYLTSKGYKVFITSNMVVLNKNLFEALPYISKVNISLHSLNPSYFKNFIKNNANPDDYLNIIKNNILKLKNNVDKISINAVVSNDKQQDLDSVLNFCKKNKILLKLVPDWRFYVASRKYIINFLKSNSFIEDNRIIKDPGSNLRIIYRKNDYYIEFKDIQPYYLNFWCEGCKMKKKCIETFAFLRLEGNPLRFKICIDKPAMTSTRFEKNFWMKFEELNLEAKNKITKQ